MFKKTFTDYVCTAVMLGMYCVAIVLGFLLVEYSLTYGGL